jgi:hypothetical protein
MAFSNTGLTSLELPRTVETLGENAFYGCTALRAVTSRAVAPPMMANEDGFAYQAYQLAALRVPQSSVNIYRNTDWWKLFSDVQGNEMFDRCYDFEQDGIYYLITGLNTVDVTYRDTQYNSYSGNVTVPATVTHNGVTYSVTGIGNQAFSICSNLTTVSLPATITRIGEKAFYYDGALSSVNLPEPLTAIGDYAFYYCSGLTSITIPINVVSIGDHALRETAISILVLPESVRELGKKVAEKCKSLTRIECHAIVPPALGDVSNKKIEVYVPATSVDAYHNAKHWKDFNKYIKPLE